MEDKKIRVRALALGLVFILTAVFSGCSKDKEDIFEPTVSSVYIREDGSVVSADIETFDESYYGEAELLQFVEEEIIAYNTSEAGIASAYDEDGSGLPVSIGSCTVADGKAYLYLNYPHYEDYINFRGENNIITAITNRTIEAAIGTGETFDAVFKDVYSETVTSETVQKEKGYYVLNIETQKDTTSADTDTAAKEAVVQIQGEIKYVSSGVYIEDLKTVKISAGTTAYIIYK